ncbi:MAG: phosphotransferase family protein [Candidatus Binatia bacterium]
MKYEKAIADFIAERTGASDVALSNFRQHTEGFSMETMSFDARWTEPSGERFSERLILRRQPEAGLLEPYDLEPQVLAMQAVQGTVAVPRFFWFEEGDAVLGAPFYVLGFVDGDVPLPFVRADGSLPIEDPRVRESLAKDFAENLAALHRFDWRAAGLDKLGVPADGAEAARSCVDTWRGYFDRSRAGPMPVMTRAFWELERRLPGDSPLCLVHGDYRTGNFIREGGSLRAVLDWEMVHVGDPMEDLAWACARMWRGQTELPGLLVERERLVAMYLGAGGFEVDEERLAFYDLLSGVKMAAIMTTGIRAYSDGRTDDVRIATFRHGLAGIFAVIGEAMGLLPSLGDAQA